LTLSHPFSRFKDIDAFFFLKHFFSVGEFWPLFFPLYQAAALSRQILRDTTYLEPFACFIMLSRDL